jgi:hypothetical protein
VNGSPSDNIEAAMMEKLNRRLPVLGQFEQLAGADGMQVA